jgi:hypothetical protein
MRKISTPAVYRNSFIWQLAAFSKSFVIGSVAFYTRDRISADAVIIFREAVKK